MLAIHQNHQNINQQQPEPSESKEKPKEKEKPNQKQTKQQSRDVLAEQYLSRLTENDEDATAHILYADNVDNMELKCIHYLKAIDLYHPNGINSLCHSKYIQCLITMEKYEESYEFIINNIHLINRKELLITNDIWIEIGNYKFENDEYEEALKMYLEIDFEDDGQDDDDEDDKDVFINIAYCYQQLNESNSALSYYYKYLQLHPKDIYCINNIAILEYYNKNYFGALQMYQKMSKQYIHQKELYFNIGVCHNNQEHYKLALSYFYKNLEVTNKNRDNCLISIAWIYCKRFENYSDALSIYKKLSKYIINARDLEFDIAWCYQQISKYKMALKYYKLYLNKYENNVNTLHNIAWIYINDDDDDDDVDHDRYKKAKPLLEKILFIDKRHFYANYTYGIYLRDIECDYNLSLKCLEIAQNIQPTNIQIKIDIAKIYKYLHNMDRAKSYYLKAIKLNDTDCYANIEYAHFCALIENYKLSDFYYKKVLNLLQHNDNNNDILNNINIVENYTNYGHVLHKLGKNMEAISVVKRAFDLNPNDCNTLNNLGFYYFCIKQYNESEKYLKLCLDINPNHEFTNSTFANLLFELKRFDEAIIYYQYAIKLKSDIEHSMIGPQILYNFAFILFKYKKQYNESLKYLKQLINQQKFETYLNDNNHKIYYLMAQIYHQLGSIQIAQHYIQKSLAINSQNQHYQTFHKILQNKIGK